MVLWQLPSISTSKTRPVPATCRVDAHSLRSFDLQSVRQSRRCTIARDREESIPDRDEMKFLPWRQGFCLCDSRGSSDACVKRYFPCRGYLFLQRQGPHHHRPIHHAYVSWLLHPIRLHVDSPCTGMNFACIEPYDLMLHGHAEYHTFMVITGSSHVLMLILSLSMI